MKQVLRGLSAAAALLAISATMPAYSHPHAYDIFNEQEKNSIAFSAKYASKPVTIDDYVVSVSASPSGIVGQISIGAKPDKYGFPPAITAMCVLRGAEEIKKFATLDSGTHILLTGTFEPQGYGKLVFKNCSFTKAP